MSEIKLERCFELESNWLSIVYQKGWVDKQAFLDAYNAEIKDVPQYLENVTVDDVAHDFVRLVPVGEGGGDMYFMLNQTPGRGAFKMTHISLDDIGLARARAQINARQLKNTASPEAIPID